MQNLNLNKEKVLNLKKDRGIDGQKARVVFCVDYSGSMSGLYRSGKVQKVLERLFPVAMAFDDDQSMEFYLFQNDYRRCPAVKLSNVDSYIDEIVMKQDYEMGGTSYSPVLKKAIKPMTESGWFLGFGSSRKKLDAPVYVIFLTDGECDDKSATYEIVKDLSSTGTFIQFIGIGNDQFNTLQKLDDLTGRALDNADFFPINDIEKISDDTLYSRLMTEFPGWVREAKNAGFIN